ncbi:hypothetical protein ACN3E9_01775 [Vibrio pectenicida]|uniref:hypothetical protein n=1 Tax=Vibrio pectenicida TaxID=62763 RepID=UPI003B9BBC0B
MKIRSLLVLCLFLSACVNNRSAPLPFYENLDHRHTFGERMPDGQNIRFIYSPEGMTDREVVINVEPGVDPVSMHFRLCEQNGVFEGLNDTVKEYINSQKFDCNSWLKLTPLINNKYALSYELNLLIGLKVEFSETGPRYTPIMKKLAQYRAIYRQNSVAYPLQRYVNETIVESTKVEFYL